MGMEVSISDDARMINYVGQRLDRAEAEVKVKMQAVIEAQRQLSLAIDRRDDLMAEFASSIRGLL